MSSDDLEELKSILAALDVHMNQISKAAQSVMVKEAIDKLRVLIARQEQQ